ncbi:MAG TPA: PqqD family protein [Candidatus Tripitaka californicus]|uniref:PqqD family protein n=1 Tax=Candidatus Tripitaka californicus TaxID=3367616 RepID=UPI00402863D9|nr:PqqD family protein [Planctomycetota bacterium]
MIDVSWRPKQRVTLATEEIEDDLFLYDPDKDHVHLLNVSASAIFELCDGTRTAQEIAQEIAKLVTPGDHDIGKDVEQTLGELREKGLIE